MEKIKNKASALDKIQRVLKGRLVDDNYALLADIAKTTRYSWGHPDFPRTTFDELNNSGNIGLIQNIDLRNQILELYRRFEVIERQVSYRKSDYPILAYKLIPRENEYDVRNDLSHDEQVAHVAAILDSNLDQSIASEINRTGYEIMAYEGILTLIRDLRDSINTELNN